MVVKPNTTLVIIGYIYIKTLLFAVPHCPHITSISRKSKDSFLRGGNPIHTSTAPVPRPPGPCLFFRLYLNIGVFHPICGIAHCNVFQGVPTLEILGADAALARILGEVSRAPFPSGSFGLSGGALITDLVGIVVTVFDLPDWWA